MNTKQMGWWGGFLMVIVCLGLVTVSGWAADTPMSSWTPTTAVWSNTVNWSAGVPNSGALGAVFDSTFSIQPDIATLPWSYLVGGIWLKSGVGQDVTINSSTPLTPILGPAVNNGLTAALLMDDSGNHSLTFGPNVTVMPGNGVNLYIYNLGTLTFQGVLKNAANDVTFIGTSTATTVNVTGQLANGGRQKICISSNTFTLSSASPGFTDIVQPKAGGILRETHVDALKYGTADIASGTLQLRSDNNNDVFHSSGSVSAVSGIGAIDVNRMNPSGGTAVSNTLRLAQLTINNCTLNITGGNGYNLAISNVTMGAYYASHDAILIPTTANLTLGRIDSVYQYNGQSTLYLRGTGSSNVVTGSILNAPSGRYSYPLTKDTSSTWTLCGTNNLTAAVNLSGGTLIAANNYALGFGGAARFGENGAMNFGWDSLPAPVLNLYGVTVNKAITQNRLLATLINANTNTASTLDNGVASITFTSGGLGFVGADVGRPVILSGGGGSGAAAIISALAANTNTITGIIGTGTGWTSTDTITLVGGGASESAVFNVIASGGAIAGLTVSNPGYGYTSAPTGYTRTGVGTGITPSYVENFTVASISMTNAGSGYTSVPVVAGTAGSGSGLVATANLSSLVLSGAGGMVAQIGGDGNLTIKAVISQGNATYPWYKIGTGVLTLTASNTFIGITTVSNGTLSVCNTAGSGTSIGTLSVISNATLAGSGTIAPTPNTGVLVALQAGSHLSPHVGTGSSNATLNVTVGNVTSNSLDIAAGTVFDYNFGAPGVGDLLSVTGRVNLGVGTNTLNIGQLSGFGAGTYPLITSTTTVTYRTTGWIFPASTHFIYSVTNTPTSVSLKVDPMPLRATIIQIR